MFGPDDLVVNFHDACVYGRDLALFESPCEWLNDACINFALTDLQVSHDADAKVKNQQATTLFLDPAVLAFLMHHCQDQDDFQDFVRGCRGFVGITRLVVPINDTLTSQNWAIPGKGSHWSLLLMERNSPGQDEEIRGFHFDSVTGSINHNVAQAVADKIVYAAGGALVVTPPRVQSCRTPTQRNCYDCGVHVIATAQIIVEVHSSCVQDETPGSYESRLFDQITDGASFCLNLRKAMADRIRKLTDSTN
eukprot:scaffold1049_cov168-Amphora_coffeaeformis.AAC.11